jgi:hypothetical protein
MADQWLEFFVCESLDADVLAAKGQKKSSKRSRNDSSYRFLWGRGVTDAQPCFSV